MPIKKTTSGFFVILSTILATLPSVAMDTTVSRSETKPWQWVFHVYDEHGICINRDKHSRDTTRVANNPVYLHGFNILHENGIKGQGTVIGFLEMGVDANHQEFAQNQVSIIDCSQYEKHTGEDRAIYRNKRNLNFNNLEITVGKGDSSHGNHVMGVSLSQP